MNDVIDEFVFAFGERAGVEVWLIVRSKGKFDEIG
jgi:hypothetical protein